jgi:ribulose-5-phosphate 4-epimerase/fuculose-1-phosphate aldolase
MNEQERQARIDLAAAFRWAVRLGYHESVANHFTLAVNDSGTEFLLHPYGLHWTEVKASDFMRVDEHGNVLEGKGKAERSAVCIHAPMHKNLPHARCVLHAHPPYSSALMSTENPRIEPISQTAARFYENVAYDDDFSQMALDFDEGERICSRLGNKQVLLMANHGVTVLGRTVAEAFDTLYHLERACENQVLAMSTGRPLKRLTDEAARKTSQQWAENGWLADDHFTALKRVLDREEPDYAH